MSLASLALLGLASLVGGAINSVAGGGTLVAFPAALASGLDAVVANATNSVAMTPGSLASAWGYRRELGHEKGLLKTLAIPSLLGGIAGAVLLLATPQKAFRAVVPGLVLFAVLLLVVQNLRKPKADARSWPKGALVAAQFGVGVYGGYFGAGMGFVMIVLLGAMGVRDIHRANGVKSVLAGAINGIGALVFVIMRAVDPVSAIVMSIGGIVGGFAGASVARKANPKIVRWLVAAFGLVVSFVLAWRAWR